REREREQTIGGRPAVGRFRRPQRTAPRSGGPASVPEGDSLAGVRAFARSAALVEPPDRRRRTLRADVGPRKVVRTSLSPGCGSFVDVSNGEHESVLEMLSSDLKPDRQSFAREPRWQRQCWLTGQAEQKREHSSDLPRWTTPIRNLLGEWP